MKPTSTAGREQIWRRAMLHRQNGEHEHAVELLVELSDAHPSAQVYAALAREYRSLARTGAAFAAYKLALQHSPHDIDTMFALAELHTELGRDEDAADVYCFALKCNPDLPEAHVNLGSAMARRGKFDEAEVCYLNAFRRTEDAALRARILYNIARVCASTDRPDGAIDGLICAGAEDADFAYHGCLDDVFGQARDMPRFERVVTLAERRVYREVDHLLKTGGRQAVQGYLIKYPYLQRIIETRSAFGKYRGLLPGRSPE